MGVGQSVTEVGGSFRGGIGEDAGRVVRSNGSRSECDRGEREL